MSCGGNRYKFWKHLTGGHNPFSALLGGSAATAQKVLERLYQRGKADGTQRLHDGTATEMEKAIATELTRRLFERMRSVGIKPPTHSKDGLPRLSSRFGYAAAYRAIAAIESGQGLPLEVRRIVQGIHSTQGANAPVGSLPKAAVDGRALSALAFDVHGYYRCANCGRFAS